MVPIPRCGCASDVCSCHIIQGDGITVTGAGTAANPFVVGRDTVGTPVGSPSGPVVSGRMSGEIILWPGISVPDGWLMCENQEVSRAVYSGIFAVTGTRFGAGNGSTTFNLPGPADAYLFGASATHPVGQSGGSSTVTLATANLPAHTHGINHNHPNTGTTGAHDHPLSRSANPGGVNANIPQGTGTPVAPDATAAISYAGDHSHGIPNYTGTSGSTGTGTPVAVDPPRIAFNLLIKI